MRDMAYSKLSSGVLDLMRHMTQEVVRQYYRALELYFTPPPHRITPPGTIFCFHV